MKLFNWINPLWIMDNFLTTRFDPVTATAAATAAAAAAPTAATVLPAVAAPSILGGGLTGAGMMTAGAPIVPGLLASSTPSLMGGLGALGSGALEYAKANPFQTASLGLSAYDRMNPSQAPLQPSPMLNAQQLIGQQGAVPVPQFNSMLQLPRKPIYIG
jgi:hypothetical protein